MNIISTVSNRLQDVFTTAAERYGRSSGFVQRRSKLTASGFIQAVVFGWMAGSQASRSELAQMAGMNGVAITAQGISDRFGTGALSLLQSVLAEATRVMISGEATALGLLQRFDEVWLYDSTTVALPKALLEEYPGCGNGAGSSASLKAHVGIELLSGRMAGPEVSTGRVHDRRAGILTQTLKAGALMIRDLGYFALENLLELSFEGVYWLTYLKNGTNIYDPHSGGQIDLVELLKGHFRAGQTTLEMPVKVGKLGVNARLLVEAVSPQKAEKRRRDLRRSMKRRGSQASAASLLLCSYRIAITNVEVERMSTPEAMALLRARWQVEILFRFWKSYGRIDEWQSRRPVAILCEIYAKLLALLAEHWITLTGAWQQPDRSIVKAASVISRGAMMIAAAITDVRRLCAVLKQLRAAQANSSRVTHRRKHPSTFQQLDVFSIP